MAQTHAYSRSTHGTANLASPEDMVRFPEIFKPPFAMGKEGLKHPQKLMHRFRHEREQRLRGGYENRAMSENCKSYVKLISNGHMRIGRLMPLSKPTHLPTLGDENLMMPYKLQQLRDYSSKLSFHHIFCRDDMGMNFDLENGKATFSRGVKRKLSFPPRLSPHFCA